MEELQSEWYMHIYLGILVLPSPDANKISTGSVQLHYPWRQSVCNKHHGVTR